MTTALQSGDIVKVNRPFAAAGKRFGIPTTLEDGTTGVVEEVASNGDAVIMFDVMLGYKIVPCEAQHHLELVTASALADESGEQSGHAEYEADDVGSEEGDKPWVDAGIQEEHYAKLLREFSFMDKNGDHRLSREQFQAGKKKLPEFLSMQEEDVSHLFSKVDLATDGTISFAEFFTYMSKRKDYQPLPSQVSYQKTRVEDNMSLLGFELCATDGGRRGVADDGNCQFYTLSWHMFSTISKHSMVRSSVVQYLSGPRYTFASAYYAPDHPSDPPDFDAYLKSMAQDKTWGDHITLQAAADVFNLRVHILGAGRFQRSALPMSGRESSFGIIRTVSNSSKNVSPPPKNVWVSFAALHYNPIKSTRRTPTVLLTLYHPSTVSGIKVLQNFQNGETFAACDWRFSCCRKRRRTPREVDTQKQRVEEDSRPLPAGWESAWSYQYKHVYYFNRATGESVWERPMAESVDRTSQSMV